VLAKAQAAPSPSNRGKSRTSRPWLEYEQSVHIWKHVRLVA
jgi:hypothetical protein